MSHGDYAKHLTFKDIDAFSAAAKAKMEKPGTAHSLQKKAPAKIVKDSKSKVGKLKVKTLAEKKAAPKKAPAKPVEKKVEKIAPKAEKLIEIPSAKPVEKKAVAPKKAPAKPAEKKAVAPKKAPAKKAK